MRRPIEAALHAGYWLLYFLMVTLVLAMLRLPQAAGRPLAVWPILVIAVVPNWLPFYAAYGPLFTRLLAKQRIAILAAASAAVSLAGASLGLILALLLFGASQPAFTKPGELATLSLWLTLIAGIHLIIGLVMRAAVDWYGSIRLREELLRRTRDMELALVRSRLDPHFLFNTINNIDALIARDPAAASTYLNALSEILRFMLYEAKGDRIALATELAYIAKYIDLERIRTRSTRYVIHEVTGDPSGLTIAPMTLVPFIENAFKHTEDAKTDGAIVSHVTIEGRRVVFDCTNRRRQDAAPQAAYGGLGNELIRRRLELLYPGRHTLHAEQNDSHYVVRLTIDT